jgi:Protein of unknown function (DUF2934)
MAVPIVSIAPKVKKQAKAKTSPASKPAAQELRASLDTIRERAFHIYKNRGSVHGNDVQDWLHAEHQVLAR